MVTEKLYKINKKNKYKATNRYRDEHESQSIQEKMKKYLPKKK